MAMLESAQKELSGSEDSESPLKPYQFRMAEIEGFRYRCKVGTSECVVSYQLKEEIAML